MKEEAKPRWRWAETQPGVPRLRARRSAEEHEPLSTLWVRARASEQSHSVTIKPFGKARATGCPSVWGVGEWPGTDRGTSRLQADGLRGSLETRCQPAGAAAGSLVLAAVSLPRSAHTFQW